MAAVAQEPEITLAQRLASNDKPIRTKALKTLRKYINLRSQKIEGGFKNEDLLKIWKGLFYCLWMQDKPLLQEELSHRISGLIHSFHTTDNQLLYFATFLQTVKREWNGIDRLRIDKFFQLVRFMFRQAFEILKRREWESSAVNRFLEVFTEQILQNTDNIPKGLMLHILDLYMIELALVGSAELTAEQNLIFLEPFCKTMTKTKDCLLLASISKNIFMRIVDHAPFAIEELLRELKQAGGDDSDSGQASGEEEENLKRKIKTGIPVDVENSKGIKHDLDLESMSSDECGGVGPVLQFDYGAIADHLFELGSHLNTRNINRTKMYSLVKIFRDLSEGVFSQNGHNNGNVSDTPDTEVFIQEKSKKKKKGKNKRPVTGDETVAKKSKACRDKQKPSESVQDDTLNDITENLKKSEKIDEENIAEPHIGKAHEGESDTQSHLETGITVKKKKKGKKLKTNLQDVGEGVAHEFQLDLEESREAHQTDKKKKGKKQCSSVQDIREVAAVNSLPAEDNPGEEFKKLSTSQKMDGDNNATQSQPWTIITQKKEVKRKKQRSCLQEVEIAVKSLDILGDIDEHNYEINRLPISGEDGILQCRQTSITKKKKKSKKPMSSSQVIDLMSQDDCKEATDIAPTVVSTETEPSETLVVRTKKKKAKEITGSKLEVDLDVKDPVMISDGTNVTVMEKKRDAKSPQAKSMKKAKKKTQISKNEEESVLEAEKQSLVQPESITHTHPPWKMNKVQKRKSQPATKLKEPFLKKENTGKEVLNTVPSDNILTPEISSLTPMKKGKKKRKLQTDEAETSRCNGHAEEELGRKKVKSSIIEDSTPVTPKKPKMEKASPKSDFASFQALTKTPTPLFCKTKPKGYTPLCSNKKPQTPKSETKKVTFGLKNNKTTEFRKTDRSLLVSPVGSSRVAFDPKKKPVSGVLKSPSLSPVLNIKKMVAKKRATAADFF